MNCNEYTEQLAIYIESVQNGNSPTMSHELAKHMSECEDCRQIATDPKLSLYFLRMFRNHQKKETKKPKILSHQLIKQPGQLWRFSYGDQSEPQICAISSKSFNTAVDTPYAIWIIPVKLNPNKKETTVSDIHFGSKETDLDIPILLETWNKCPIYTSQLMDYICDLSDDQWKKVSDYIENPPEEELSANVQLFREYEISKAEKFYSTEFLRNEKTVAVINYAKGATVPWFDKIKDAFIEFLNKILAEDVAQLPFKESVNTDCEMKALIIKPSKAQSILDSVFRFFKSIDAGKLWHQAKVIGGATGSLLYSMGITSISALAESASSFYREINSNKNEEIIKLASILSKIEAEPQKTTFKYNKGNTVLNNVSNLFKGLGNSGKNQINNSESEDKADFQTQLEDDVLIYVTSQHNKQFNLKIFCRECYFDFATSTGEITFSRSRLDNFSACDITSLEIETESAIYRWHI